MVKTGFKMNLIAVLFISIYIYYLENLRFSKSMFKVAILVDLELIQNLEGMLSFGKIFVIQ